jgi:hypothetical protein
MKKVYLYCLVSFAFTANYAQQNATFVTTEITESIVPFIDQLKNGEQFTLHFASDGCFHNEKDKIVFQKEQNAYYVIYQNQKKKLDIATIEHIQNFEKELDKQGDMGCTTVDKYLLIYKDSQRIVTDGSCAWNGYGKLKKVLQLT